MCICKNINKNINIYIYIQIRSKVLTKRTFHEPRPFYRHDGPCKTTVVLVILAKEPATGAFKIWIS